MSKQVRRPYKDEQQRAPEVKYVPGNRGRISPRRQITVTKEQLQEEYSYVSQDLRRILVLAVLLFVLLIGLNIGLPYLGF